MIARQKELSSGRLDLLFLSKSELFLVELKVEPFRTAFLDQVLGYRDELVALQNEGNLVRGEINTILLTTHFLPNEQEECRARGVTLACYEPANVLRSFYSQLAGLSNFLTIRPKDLGVWNIHVVNRVLYGLPRHNTIAEVSAAIGIAYNTVRNHLRFAGQLGLTSKFGDRYLLTDLGRAYVGSRNPTISDFLLTDEQTRLLREYIIKDPFASNTIFGIYSLVEAVFVLARNSYPVEMTHVVTYFRESVGKRYEWITDRSAWLGANAFSNFGVELGLLAREGDKVLLTPAGFRFILMLQLHKGIRIVDSLGLGVDS